MARRRLLSFLFLLFCLAAFAGFIALGVWQVQRLGWKEDLIARVDVRVHAAPVTPPAPDLAGSGGHGKRPGLLGDGAVAAGGW